MIHRSRSTIRACYTGKGLKRVQRVRAGLVLLHSRYWFTAADRKTKQNYIFGVSMCLVGSSSAQSDPVVTCLVSRL